MKTKLKYVLLILIFIFIHAKLATAANYSKNCKFSAVKLTYDDLRALLQRIHAIVPEDHNDLKYSINNLTLSDGKLQIDINIDDNWEIQGLRRLPEAVFDLRYQLYRPDRKIQRIEIKFSDYEREILVAGSDADLVDSAYDSLSGIIKEHTGLIGGAFFKMICGVLLLILGTSLMARSLEAITKTNRRPVILSFIALLIIATAIILVFNHRWFPGFVIYAGPLSFAERYAPQIGLCGFIVAIIGLIPFIHSLRTSGRIQKVNPNRHE
jgi:hypothetical protein